MQSREGQFDLSVTLH
nr:unnamed protein product [Callosobruchus chinensis]